ncbi:MAG TPA: hypothetical protein PK239_09375 [Chitinophagales bacterium]|nr:hypothetical protein [Chitinophagales bacterium]HRK27487.1 hypothetical protein [Chitinophagales bacterium]
MKIAIMASLFAKWYMYVNACHVGSFCLKKAKIGAPPQINTVAEVKPPTFQSPHIGLPIFRGAAVVSFGR